MEIMRYEVYDNDGGGGGGSSSSGGGVSDHIAIQQDRKEPKVKNQNKKSLLSCMI